MMFVFNGGDGCRSGRGDDHRLVSFWIWMKLNLYHKLWLRTLGISVGNDFKTCF